MIAEIETFLKKQFDYKVAVELYLHYSTDKKLETLLKSGENSFTSQKVIQALRLISESSLATVYHAKEKRAETGDFRVNSAAKHIRIDYAALPSSLKLKMDEKSALYRHANTLFSELDFLKDDQSRLNHAIEILDNFDQIDKIFSEVEDYQERGILNPSVNMDVSFDALTGLQLAQLRDNLKKNLYKVRGNQQKIDKFRQLTQKIKEVENALSKR
jgi:hypothetical protein